MENKQIIQMHCRGAVTGGMYHVECVGGKPDKEKEFAFYKYVSEQELKAVCI